MNNFDTIIGKKTKELLEYAANPAIKQAVDNIEKALKVSGQVSSNPNSKALADELFHVSKDEENPLQSAFNKIKEDPENPKLTPVELQAYLNIAKRLNPEKEEENKTTKQTNQPTTQNQQKTTTTTSQQPNAKQYNPLNQATA